MRLIPFLTSAVLLASPAVVRGQSVELYGSAGPTITDAGNSVATGLGVWATPKFGVFGGVERTHLPTRTQREAGSISSFRGGTYLLGSAELRCAPLGHNRVGPFFLAGFAAGQSTPNVNDIFPTPVTNDARAVFAGGGLLVPLGPRAAIFADARMQFGAEGTEGIVAAPPVRGGIALRF